MPLAPSQEAATSTEDTGGHLRGHSWELLPEIWGEHPWEPWLWEETTEELLEDLEAKGCETTEERIMEM